MHGFILPPDLGGLSRALIACRFGGARFVCVEATLSPACTVLPGLGSGFEFFTLLLGKCTPPRWHECRTKYVSARFSCCFNWVLFCSAGSWFLEVQNSVSNNSP